MQSGDIAKSLGEASRGAARNEAAMLSDDEDYGEEPPRGADSSSSSDDGEDEATSEAAGDEDGDEVEDEATAEAGGDEDGEEADGDEDGEEADGDEDGEEADGDEWEELDDASMHDGAAPPPAAASQRIPQAKPKSAPAVIELLDSSSEDDEEAPVPEAGPPAWSNPNDPRCSYLFHPRLDAQTLHDAESILLPRARGSRTGRPWGGWREGKVIALPEPGIYCTAGGAQCLWDGEWLNDEVRRAGADALAFLYSTARSALHRSSIRCCASKTSLWLGALLLLLLLLLQLPQVIRARPQEVTGGRWVIPSPPRAVPLQPAAVRKHLC